MEGTTDTFIPKMETNPTSHSSSPVSSPVVMPSVQHSRSSSLVGSKRLNSDKTKTIGNYVRFELFQDGRKTLSSKSFEISRYISI